MDLCSTRPAPTEAYMTVPQHHRSTVFNTTNIHSSHSSMRRGCSGVKRNPLYAKNESSTPMKKLLSGDSNEKERGVQTGCSFAAASRDEIPRARGRSSAARDSFATCLRKADDASGSSLLAFRADNTKSFVIEGKKSHSASTYHVYDSKKDQSGVYTSFLRLQQKMVSLGFDDWSSIREADVFGGVLFPFAVFLRFLLQEGAPEVTLSLMTEYDWFLVEVDDKALIKSLYRVLAERFHYRPSITAAQFCQSSSPLSALPMDASTCLASASTSLTTKRSASPMLINALNASRKIRKGKSHPPGSVLGSPSVPYNSRPTVSSSICVSLGRQNSAALRSASLLRNGGANHASAKIQLVRDVIGLFLRAKADLERDADRLRNFRELMLLEDAGNGTKSESGRLFLSDLRRDEDRSKLGEALIQRHHHHQSFVDPEANMTVYVEEHEGEKQRGSAADPVGNPLVFAALQALQKKKDSNKSIMTKNTTSTSNPHMSSALRLRDVTATTNNAANSTLSLSYQRLKTKDVNTQLVLTPPSSEQCHDSKANNTQHGSCCRHLRHVLTREEDLRKEALAQEARRLAMLHKALNKLQREKVGGEDQQ